MVKRPKRMKKGGFVIPAARPSPHYIRRMKKISNDTGYIREGFSQGVSKGKETAKGGFNWMRRAAKDVKKSWDEYDPDE